jgi:hypothetical protein
VSDHYFTLYNDSKINVIYYDMEYGFIGFDDTENGLEFRLVQE